MAHSHFDPPPGQLGVFVEQALAISGQAKHLVKSAHGPFAYDFYRGAAKLFHEAGEFCEKAAKEVKP